MRIQGTSDTGASQHKCDSCGWILTLSRWKSELHCSQSRLERITDSILAKLNMPDISTFDEDGNPTVTYDMTSVYGDRSTQVVPVSTSLPGNTPNRYQSTQLSHSNGPSPQYIILPHSPNSLHREEEPEQANNSGDNGSGEDDVLVSEPMGSLYEVTKLNKFRRRPTNSTQNNDSVLDDFISRGVVSLAEAEELLVM